MRVRRQIKYRHHNSTVPASRLYLRQQRSFYLTGKAQGNKHYEKDERN
jgi:hypothetical protein